MTTHAKASAGREEHVNGLERERVTDIQRARMLAAMFDVVSEVGAGGVSVANVVARSGVSRRTFYELFEDREDCFLAALDEAVRCACEQMQAACQGSERWRERVRAALVALLRFLDDEPAMARLMVVEALAAGPKAQARRQRALARVIEAVDEGRGESSAVAQAPPLAAEGVVGAVFSVIHARVSEREPEPLLRLAGPLMSMIVLPYLGQAASKRELARPLPPLLQDRPSLAADPLRGLDMRLTYRTVRVLVAIAASPGASNRQIAVAADVTDQGQMSKLLNRLHHVGLIENTGTAGARGEPNAWTLTHRGREVEHSIHARTERRAA